MTSNRMTVDRILLYCVCLISIVSLGLIVKREVSSPEVAYVDIGKVIENYSFKKDLEVSSGRDLNRIKLVVDSLTVLKRMSGGVVSAVDTQLANAEYALQQYYVMSNQEVNKKIWERLNPLMLQFGEEKKLELLIGADGAGNVLYGSKDRDVTDELIRYINTKYDKGS